MVFVSLCKSQTINEQKQLKPTEITSKTQDIIIKDIMSLENSKIWSSDKKLREFEKAVKYGVTSLLESGNIICEGEVYNFFQELSNHLIQANDLKISPKIYVYNNNYPNAASFPDGSIFMNTGLLTRFTNFEEVVFVLAHELAHLVKKHSVEGYLKKKRLEKKFEIAKGSYLEIMKFSQENELEADELAIAYMEKAGFDIKKAMLSLKLISYSDTITMYDTTIAQSLFMKLTKNNDSINSAQIIKDNQEQFQKIVFNQDATKRDNGDEFSTHPDVERRLANIDEYIKLNYNTNLVGNKSNLTLLSKYDLEQIKKQAIVDVVEASFNSGMYHLSLYLSARYKQYFGDVNYFNTMVIKNLIWIYSYKDMNLSALNNELTSSYGKEYELVVNIINNLKTNELKLAGYNYIENIEIENNTTEDIYFYKAYLAELNLGKNVTNMLFKKYLSSYPNGKYSVIAKHKTNE
jgi:Zn-dependent protease with chaperone function